jgi:hypothetical protein
MAISTNFFLFTISNVCYVSFWALLLTSFALAGVLPKYFSSEWSVAQFRLPEGSHCIVAFGHQKNTVAILGMDGR